MCILGTYWRTRQTAVRLPSPPSKVLIERDSLVPALADLVVSNDRPGGRGHRTDGREPCELLPDVLEGRLPGDGGPCGLKVLNQP